MIPSKETRNEWRRLANSKENMISAVGEYTPAEFIVLLDAVDDLETRLAVSYGSAKKWIETCVKAAVSKEREACAAIVADMTDHWRGTQSVEVVNALEKVTEAIRRRK